jgi:hypothetical protein
MDEVASALFSRAQLLDFNDGILILYEFVQTANDGVFTESRNPDEAGVTRPHLVISALRVYVFCQSDEHSFGGTLITTRLQHLIYLFVSHG